MPYYDAELRSLRQQADRKVQLQTMLHDLYARQYALRDEVAMLRETMDKEQTDVDRLEQGGNLYSFFYNVVGKMDQQLTREKEEAYAARVKYDASAAQLRVLEEDIARKEREMAGLRDCEERYECLLRQRMEELKISGSVLGRRIMELEQKLARLEGEKRELDEAIAAGRSALMTAEEILSSLSRADGWATWDLFGGGVISDLAKYSNMDRAQAMIQQLQIQLQRFRTELCDITINTDIQVGVDNFMRFADYFFDNLFTDWMVKNQIADSQAQVYATRNQINEVLGQVERRLEHAHWEWEKTKEELDGVVRRTAKTALEE